MESSINKYLCGHVPRKTQKQRIVSEKDWKTGVTRKFTFRWTPFWTISIFFYHEYVIASQK